MFVPTWFVTLFAKQLPLPLCARVWDLYFVEGERYIYKAAVGILKLLGAKLKQMDDEEALGLLLGRLDDHVGEHSKVLLCAFVGVSPRFKQEKMDHEEELICLLCRPDGHMGEHAKAPLYVFIGMTFDLT